MTQSEPGHFEQLPYSPPPGATEIYLIRHGASAAKVDGTPFPLLDDQGNPGLAPTGLAQAEAVGARLAGEKISAIFTSPLARTHQTAAPLVNATGIEPRELRELTEVRLGIFEGGEYRARAARQDPIIKRAFAEERWDVIPGAEPADEFGVRVARALDVVLAETGPSGRAAVFAHSGVIGEICHQITGSRPFAFVHVDNASISRVIVTEQGGRLLRTFNDSTHLPARDAAPSP